MKVLDRFELSTVRFRSVGSQRVVELYQQFTSTVARQSGDQQPGMKTLFARPSINRRQGVVEWITELPGNDVKRFDALDEEEQNTVIARLSPMLAFVRALGDRASSAAGDKRQLFDVLSPPPRSEDIYLVDDYPVLINWGCEPREGTTETVGLFNAIPSVSPAPETLSEPGRPAGGDIVYVGNRRSWAWLWPLLLLLLLLLLLTLLVRGCDRLGIAAPIPDLMGTLPPVDATIPEPRLQLEADLRAEIGRLNVELGDAVQACAPQPVSEADERLRQRGRSVGIVNVALTWNNRHDLDLIVEDPNGERISYRNTRTASGGFLDIDMNAAGNTRTNEPIENIRWEGTEPVPGLYKVYVLFFDRYDPESDIDPTPFKLTVTVRDHTETISGRAYRADQSKTILVHQFQIE